VKAVKSWKEQLKDVKRALREADLQDEMRDEKPAKVDFEPPKSWLTDDRSISKRDGESMGSYRPAPIPSTVADRQTGVHPRVAPTVRNPVQQPTTPNAVSASSDKPSASNRITTPPVFRPRIDGARALDMPEWSEAGRSLQHPDRQVGKAAPMVVRIGVDFGTAFTKVAIRAGVDLVPVDWFAVTGDESPTGRYVMPGFVARAPDGEYCWRRLAESDVRGNLKLSVIEMAGSHGCPAATLAYLS
jgi:hypothetical protein